MRQTLVEATIEATRSYPRGAIEAAAKAKPFLLRETAIIYRCPFCRKSWRAQAKKRAERHLVHCFERPDRVPYLGEIREHETDPNSRGQIWDGRGWRDIYGEVPDVKAWAARLKMFDDFALAFLRLYGGPDAQGDHIDDARLIRFVHGSGS